MTSRRDTAFSLVGASGLIAAWWFLPSQGSVLLPPLESVLTTLVDLFWSGTLLQDAAMSISRVLMGVAIATVLAALFGFVAMVFRPFIALTALVTETLRPVPPLAWVPLSILAFGLGSTSAVAIVTTAAFFPIWFAIVFGLKCIEPRLLMVADSLGAGRWTVLSSVEFPSILPHFLHGIRVGIGNGWISVIAAEMVGVGSGLGHEIQVRSLNLQMEAVYVYILVIGVSGFTMGHLATLVVRSFPAAQDRAHQTPL